jgi:4-hydroxybenzoyl-CoA thioesterase
MHFEREQLIRFSHCDPAGIVFFPQYFVMFNGLVEDWFDDGLGLGYANVVVKRRVGLPTVALKCDFQLPSRMGERVRLRLGVERLGRSSITLALECRSGDEVRVRLQQVLVTTALDSGRPIAIPDDVRAAIERFEKEADAAAPLADER